MPSVTSMPFKPCGQKVGRKMNRFIIEKTQEEIARSLCDQHIVKMPLEEAQMLCTAVRVHAPDFAEEAGIYKTAYLNHPCTQWARETRINYRYAVRLFKAMNDEYMHRYPLRRDGTANTGHASMRHFDALVEAEKYIPDLYNFMTPHPQCFSGWDECKTDENWPIRAYRAFYALDKMSFAKYKKGRDMPDWMNPMPDWLERIYDNG